MQIPNMPIKHGPLTNGTWHLRVAVMLLACGIVAASANSSYSDGSRRPSEHRLNNEKVLWWTPTAKYVRSSRVEDERRLVSDNRSNSTTPAPLPTPASLPPTKLPLKAPTKAPTKVDLLYYLIFRILS